MLPPGGLFPSTDGEKAPLFRARNGFSHHELPKKQKATLSDRQGGLSSTALLLIL
jgi:hypothetical protein